MKSRRFDKGCGEFEENMTRLYQIADSEYESSEVRKKSYKVFF